MYLLDLFGTAIFAIYGVLLASKVKMDYFGAIVLASVTAVGGGTIRDAILGATPVFWIQHDVYIYVILLTCLFTIILLQKINKLAWWILPVCDAIGLATFVGIGIEKTLQYSESYIIAIIMGVMTGCGGGIIRDVLAREIPMVLRSEIYASACIVGGIVHTLCLYFNTDAMISLIAGAITTLTIRLATIYWKLSLPPILKFS